MSTAMTPVMVVKRYFDTLAELLHGTWRGGYHPTAARETELVET
jgi:hypothetical protein